MASSFKDDTPQIQRKILYHEWVGSSGNEKLLNVMTKIRNELGIYENSEDFEQIVLEESKYFCLNIERLWKNCNRTRNTFEKKHENWLNGSIIFPALKSQKNLSADIEQDPQPGTSRGRPQKLFEDASTKTKIRRVEALLANYTPEELSFAAQRSANLKKTSISDSDKSLTPQQALALFYDLNLSYRKYSILRSTVNAVHKDCFPSYRTLLKTKNKYLPARITATETSAETNLQELLQKTIDSILKIIDPKQISETNLKLICKWGFDGSSGHSLYKQTFEDIHSTDEYMFLVALVPLKLIDRDSHKIIWSNPRPSSTFYCRPVKFQFIKENADIIRQEDNYIKKAISELSIYEIRSELYSLNVSFEMLFTMFDGSVANILSGTNATSKCIVCGATPKEMNSDKVLAKISNIENYKFGLSILHCWIRCFECLLHISYRLQFKTWQIKGEENKQIAENAKSKIQAEFKSKMGLIVDKPKPGYGSTNDGNTARRFFYNPELSAQITGIDKNLISKFSLILRILACGRKINIDKFKILLNDTRILYLNLYGWFYMPSTVHKILVHGCDIINFFELPIGQLSEEALEARHKEFRKIRLCNTRISSRVSTNIDIIKTLLLTSDPHISSLRKTTMKNKINNSDTDILEYLHLDESTSQVPFALNLPDQMDISEDSSDSSD